MKKNIFLLFILTLGLFQLAMARPAQYDEEARAAERLEKQRKKWEEKEEKKGAVRQFAGGLKQVTVDNTRDAISETAEGTLEEGPVVGTIEGAKRGSAKILDNTVKGVAKVATFGQGDVENYEIEEPEKGTDETTKIKIKIPGT